MNTLADLILEAFRWKHSQKKQFFDEEIRVKLKAMERHHEFYLRSIDSIEKAIDLAAVAIATGSGDVMSNLQTLETRLADFRSSFRIETALQDALLSQIDTFLGSDEEKAPANKILASEELAATKAFFESISAYFYLQNVHQHKFYGAVLAFKEVLRRYLRNPSTADGFEELIKSLEILKADMPNFERHVIEHDLPLSFSSTRS